MVKRLNIKALAYRVFSLISIHGGGPGIDDLIMQMTFGCNNNIQCLGDDTVFL